MGKVGGRWLSDPRSVLARVVPVALRSGSLHRAAGRGPRTELHGAWFFADKEFLVLLSSPCALFSLHWRAGCITGVYNRACQLFLLLPLFLGKAQSPS